MTFIYLWLILGKSGRREFYRHSELEKVHSLVYIGDFKADAQKALMNAGYKEVKAKEGKLDELLEQVPMKKGPQRAVKKPTKKQPQL